MNIPEILDCSGRFVFMSVNGRQTVARLSVPPPYDCAYLDFSECAGILPRKLGRYLLSAEDMASFQKSGMGAIFSSFDLDAPALRAPLTTDTPPVNPPIQDEALQTWNPIASAPSDGSIVLVYGQSMESQAHYTIAQFRGGQWWPAEPPLNYADAEPMRMQPSHWQAIEPFKF